MIVQSPLNVVLKLLPDKTRACSDLLAQMKPNPTSSPILPFGQLKNVHYARLLILPRANDRVGESYGATLILATRYG